MKASFVLLVVSACLAASGYLAVSAQATGQRAAFASCGNVIGAKWVFPHSGGKVSGNKYGVTVNGVSCAKAKKFAKTLSSVKPLSSAQTAVGTRAMINGTSGEAPCRLYEFVRL